MISLIAAIGENNELGKDNHLIWPLKEDLKYFKETTTNHKVIMGLKNYLSIGRPLPNRKNIVLTTHKEKVVSQDVVVYDNMEELMQKEINPEEEVFIIGGSTLYNEFIQYAQKLYLTEIFQRAKDADVYFPKFIKDEWHKKILKKSEENGIKFQFTIYERIAK